MNAVSPRLCIFCGNTGRSAEHIYSEWTYPHLAHYDVAGQRVQVGSSPVRRGGTIDLAIRERVRKGESTLSVTVDGPCRDCNSGWMSMLEREVEPVLLPLITAGNVLLDPAKLKVLVNWLTSKFMTIDVAQDKERPDSPFFYQSERGEFFNARTIPEALKSIWMARLDGPEWRLANSRIGGSNIATFSMGVGNVFFYGVCFRIPRLQLDKTDTLLAKMHPVWPLPDADICWPPATPALKDDEAESVTQSLHNFLRQPNVQLAATRRQIRLKIAKKIFPKAVTMVAQQGTFFFGDEFDDLMCGSCSRVLFNGVSLQTLRERWPPVEEQLLTQCPCGAKNLLPVRGTKRV